MSVSIPLPLSDHPSGAPLVSGQVLTAVGGEPPGAGHRGLGLAVSDKPGGSFSLDLPSR
jgi:hypothetical protein